MRGSATFSSLSRKSNIRRPLSVTLTPMGIPSRSLNAATDFFARMTIGACPVISFRSMMAASIARAFVIASPRPMLTTTFSMDGTCIASR